jgi:hypothetical protein
MIDERGSPFRENPRKPGSSENPGFASVVVQAFSRRKPKTGFRR